MEGKIKSWNAAREFGFISIEGGLSYFFHARDNQIRGAKVGARVSFDLADDPLKPGVDKAVRLLDYAPVDETQTFNKIYCNNLGFETSEQKLWSLFSEFGEVVDVQIIRDRETGSSRGFAFVKMRHDRDALLAIEQLSRTELDGRQLGVQVARPRR